jgi:hypothetical protein
LAGGLLESFYAVLPWRAGSVYGRSYWAHVVSGLADFWLSELVYRASLPQLQRHFPNLFPPPQPLGIDPRRTQHAAHNAPHALDSSMGCDATFFVVRLVQVDEMLEGRQARKATKIRRNLAIASLRFFSGYAGNTRHDTTHNTTLHDTRHATHDTQQLT